MLIRTALVRADSAGRTLYGRLVPYDVFSTVSDDGRRFYQERIAPGAFERSIAERGHKLRLFVQHDTRKMPIGKAVELEERADGLHGSFALARTRDAEDALELVSSGTVDGFSIGFYPIRHRNDGPDKVTQLEASLREVSLVHSPAHPGALVMGVRSAADPRTVVALAKARLTLRLKTW